MLPVARVLLIAASGGARKQIDKLAVVSGSLSEAQV